MLPRFNVVKQRTATIDTVIVNLSWGTLVFGFTMSRRPLELDFEDDLYPQQRGRNTIAIILLVLLHLFLAYMLLSKKVELPLKQGEKEGQLIMLDLRTKVASNKPKPAKTQPEKKSQKATPTSKTVTRPSAPRPVVESVRSSSPVPTAPAVDTMSQVAAARQRRQALEDQASTENSQAQAASQGPTDNDVAMARIKANIAAANYNRKGTNGVFQILDKGVQNGRFSFRGWTNNPRESTRQTFEVDAGVGGDVELALIRRMIALIREHYKGDFNWESQRLGRVIQLSARPEDNATLENFMMKEFFDRK